MYNPKGIHDLRTPVKLLIPNYEKYNGVRTLKYPAADKGELIFVNWKTYGGTENNINGIISIVDTAQVTTWFRPDIAVDCIVELQDGRQYKIISEPENIEMQNKYCVFKVERVKGSGTKQVNS